MRKITRTAMPAVLASSATTWRDELLAELAASPANRSKILSSRKVADRYSHKQIMDGLTGMFRSLCAYCESRTGVCSWEHVEHYLPKNDFPEFTFDWNNLHLACQKCNILKSSKFSSSTPLIDPVYDQPDQHFEFYGEHISGRTRRGTYSIATLGLERDSLVEDRKGVLSQLTSQLARIRTAVTEALALGTGEAARAIRIDECDRWLVEAQKLMDHGSPHSSMLEQVLRPPLQALQTDVTRLRAQALT